MRELNACDAKTQQILDISRDLVAAMPLEQLLHKIVAVAVTLTEVEAAGLLLLNAQTGDLKFMAASEFSDQLLNIPVPVDRSIAGAAFLSNEVVLVPDVKTDPRYYKAVEEQIGLVARSLLAVPMLFKGKCIGVLEVENKHDRVPFGQDDIETLTTLAAQAAVAIENARLIRTLQQRAAEQAQALKDAHQQRQLSDALRRAGVALSSTLDYDEVLELILEQIAHVVPHDAANIMVIEDNLARVFRGRGYERFGTAETLQSTNLEFRKVPGLQRMWETRQPIAIPDVSQDKNWVYSRPEHRWIRSYAGVPMVARDRVIGFLNVISATPNFFHPADADHLQMFAYQAAVAIDNARLYRQAQREIEERLLAERELQKHREHLEELVAVRTTDLSKAVARDRLLNAKLQQEIAERERLIDDLRAFSHTVAHDLKSPLSLISGYAELLLEPFDEDEAASMDFDVHQAMETIQRTVYRMERIIAELLTLASVRQQDVKPHALDMAAIVTEVEARLAHDITASKAHITQPETWPQAIGYAPWIEEVWANYLSNAIKYGGNVDAGIPPQIEMGGAVEPVGDKVSVRFWVRDNGPGISAEGQARLFDKFMRLEGVRARGHGLGLSIVKRIVEKLGGQVGLESQLGKGSTFFFTLPVARRGLTSEEMPPDKDKDEAAWTLTAQAPDLLPGTLEAIDEPAMLAAQQLAMLPSGLVNKLKQAVMIGDVEHVDALVAQVTQQDSALGAILDEMAYNFDHKRMLALIQAAQAHKTTAI